MQASAASFSRSNDHWLRGIGISRIYIHQLFGEYTYDLSIDGAPDHSASRILLLYGNNGAGKTTLLRAAFFLLSHIDKKGHKNQLTKIPFTVLQVDFAQGVSVVASREHHKLKGFDLIIVKDGEVIASAPYFKEPESLEKAESVRERLTLLRAEEEIDHRQAKVLSELKNLSLKAIYVTDKRRVFRTGPRLNRFLGVGRHVSGVRSDGVEDEKDGEALSLPEAIIQVRDWTRTLAFSSSARGEDDVNAVYAAIVKKLARAESNSEATEATFENLIKSLHDLEGRSKQFAVFNLTQPLQVQKILEPLQSLIGQRLSTAIDILEPYVEGLKARYEALDPLRTKMSEFVSLVSSYYHPKRVALDLRNGLQIFSAKGELLTPQMLSSGEGQLLFLLASTLTAKETSSLFIIDEPEISLNVNWQRQFVGSLLELTKDKEIQFVMATHSIELLTQYSESVLPLENIADR